jgi:hypothetical protein
VIVRVCGADVWPLTVTVIVAGPGWSGNGPESGGRVKVIEVSLQGRRLGFTAGLD